MPGEIQREAESPAMMILGPVKIATPARLARNPSRLLPFIGMFIAATRLASARRFCGLDIDRRVCPGRLPRRCGRRQPGAGAALTVMLVSRLISIF